MGNNNEQKLVGSG